MNGILRSILAALVIAGMQIGAVRADSYDDTIRVFKDAGKSGTFFQSPMRMPYFLPSAGLASLSAGLMGKEESSPGGC